MHVGRKAAHSSSLTQACLAQDAARSHHHGGAVTINDKEEEGCWWGKERTPLSGHVSDSPKILMEASRNLDTVAESKLLPPEGLGGNLWKNIAL